MKRHRNRAGIEFDMTPLLDVIFIVLMVVMCHQALDAQDAQEIIEAAEGALDEANSANGIYKTQLDAYENANDLVVYVTIYADYETGNPKTRHIKVARDNDTAFDDITVTPTTETEMYERFEEEIETYISSNEAKPVLVMLNEDQILYRDQQKISKIIQELDDKYDNLYITGKQDE